MITFQKIYSDPTARQRCEIGISTTAGYNIGPFHHDYHCWINHKGQRVCRGYSFDPSGNPGLLDKIFGEIDGVVINDEENTMDGKEETCTVDDGSNCMDICVSTLWSVVAEDPPKYGLIRGQACQSLADSIYTFCRSMCDSL
jgi:hypothetical protein